MSKSLFRITFSAVLATLIVFQGVSVSRAEEAPAEGSDRKLWSYEESYRKNVEDVCKKAWNPANGSVIQAKDLIYPKIGSKNADKQYREGVKSVGGDVSGIGEILSDISGDDPFSFGSDIALASETYKERMNGIFACAQINFKIRTHERLLRTIKGEKADNGNTAKRVEEQTKLLRQEMRKRKCADRTATEGKNNIMMKKDLLRQSTYEYCNYRHYLQYLKFNTQ
ncbi:MAG: hypothetical protein QG650_464 [Patescibacteria group bacterium]|nr:hypothetical protein [Patescibacteria group bacterium]